MSMMSSYALAPFVGSHLNMFLYTGELALTFWYLRNSKTIPIYKYGIYASIVIDGLGSLFVIANVYVYMIALSDEIVTKQGWPTPGVIVLNYASATIEQCFFMYRYWMISRNRYMTALLTFFIFGHVVCTLATAIYISIHTFLGDPIGFDLTIAAAASCAGTDILIAASLAWALGSINTHYSSTKILLRRIAVYAVSCGITTAISTTLTVLLLFTNIHGFLVMFAVLGRIYTLTILINVMLLRASAPSDATFSITRAGDVSEPVVLSPIHFTHNLPSDEFALGDPHRKSAAGIISSTHHVRYDPPERELTSSSPTTNSFHEDVSHNGGTF
ncbi:hypothetical protein CPB85DRAFT_1433484 [Mucidula mucida]|nr:hypothetical protein CPB85DRAFT_1433484 [Mucidula mucida]